jgi:hypothetical protein
MSAGQWGSFGGYNGSFGGWGRTDIVGRESYGGIASVGAASEAGPLAGYGGAYGGRIDVPWQDVYATATKKEINDPAGYMSVYARWLELNPDVDAYAKNLARNKLEKAWKDLSKIRGTTAQAEASEAQAFAQRAAGKEISRVAPVSSSSSDDAILASLMAPASVPTISSSSASSTPLILAGLGTVAAVGLLAWFARSQ